MLWFTNKINLQLHQIYCNCRVEYITTDYTTITMLNELFVRVYDTVSYMLVYESTRYSYCISENVRVQYTEYSIVEYSMIGERFE